MKVPTVPSIRCKILRSRARGLDRENIVFTGCLDES